mmetsp:Transcript_11103/g.26775  ORF Transcript_11103/g.26775 Transcript_11103/m.26775 type:complete len:231 (+) Transcript_11103:1408-2100(+)
MVGNADGVSVGLVLLLEAIDGSSEGTNGKMVGSCDGGSTSTVGTALGVVDGGSTSTVGVLLGSSEGVSLGCSDGKTVGAVVSSVGAPVIKGGNSDGKESTLTRPEVGACVSAGSGVGDAVVAILALGPMEIMEPASILVGLEDGMLVVGTLVVVVGRMDGREDGDSEGDTDETAANGLDVESGGVSVGMGVATRVGLAETTNVGSRDGVSLLLLLGGAVGSEDGPNEEVS